RLDSAVRGSDVWCRLGGDEFALVASELADRGAAARVAERVLRVLVEPFEVAGHVVPVSASLGVAVGSEAEVSPESLLRDATLAMRSAKQGGRARYELFDPVLDRAARDRRTLEEDLRLAIGREELLLHYQPQVCLATGALVGVEALVRWQHPRHGLLEPARFVPLAEESGLIVPIGEWVLQQACAALHRLQGVAPGQPLLLSVNISGRQVQEGAGLVEQVASAIESSDLEPSNLVLEITETVLMADTSAATATLRALEELGVGLAIDDFGTGYSSLSYLHHLPVSMLKLDKSFVTALESGANVAVVRAIASLAAELGLKLIAEGIETPAQLQRLRGLGYALGQGHHFARPMPAETLLAEVAGTLSQPGRLAAGVA
ncbi:MAG: putative bifunctional diguanylate cyclase/phosphodiesterase, partial [Longimicrobiales bacterium]